MESVGSSKSRFGYEKQEHLIKLGILTTASILCKFFSVEVVRNEAAFEVRTDFQIFIFSLSQHSLHAFFRYCASRV